MTSPLAADLGRLARPARAAAPFDEVRLALLDALIAAKSAGPLTQGAWEDAFGASVRSLRLRVLADAEQSLRAAAAYSRYPARRLAALLPNADVADALLQRLLAAAMPLEQLAAMPDDGAGRRARGAALDDAWAGAESVAGAEVARWRRVAADVAEWRRPSIGFWIGAAVMVLLALLLAAWLSGDVASPGWFAPINVAWWRLWP